MNAGAVGRSAFTLIEIMIAIMIFAIISAIMLGVLLGSTRLFQAGEAARASNDKAMAVIGLLKRDLQMAIPAAQGGTFYARRHDPANGNCWVGWSIDESSVTAGSWLAGADYQPGDEVYHGGIRYHCTTLHTASGAEEPGVGVDWNAHWVVITDDKRFVLWGVDATSDPQQRLLKRSVVDGVGALRLGFADHISTTEALLGNGTVVTRGVLHFSCWLAGTLHETSPGSGVYVRSIRPADDAHWTEVIDSSGTSYVAEPDPTFEYYAGTDDGYPLTARFVLLASGGKRFDDNGDLIYPFEGVVVRDDGPGGGNLRIAGVQSLATLPGSLLLIGEELVGYHGVHDGRLLINSDPSHGPVDPGSGEGRGVYRSTATAHARGEAVRSGRLYQVVHSFAQ